jgi:nucleotide-binding universal stress UspA family protein
MYKKILIGMDASDDAFRAAKKALEVSKRDGSTVVAFHSVVHHLSEINPTFTYTAGRSSALSLTIHEDYVKRGEEILKKVQEMINKEIANIKTKLIFDITPEDYIKQAVEKENYDLVILGYKGHHSVLSRALLGTVPDNVINNTSCDVLIVR